MKILKQVFNSSVLLSLVLALFSHTSAAEDNSKAKSSRSIGNHGIGAAFSQGASSFGVVIGSGSAFDENYFILGAGFGYYVAQGLELGIDAQHWFSAEPEITKVTPKITYVFSQLGSVNPYVGAFYRRTFYGDGDINGQSIEDQNSYGYRAGAYLNSSDRVYIGGGIVHEKYMDCSPLVDCSSTYPELIFTVSF